MFLLNAQIFHIDDIDEFVDKVCEVNIPQEQLRQISMRVVKHA